jgi:hypothetical protein
VLIRDAVRERLQPTSENRQHGQQKIEAGGKRALKSSRLSILIPAARPSAPR